MNETPVSRPDAVGARLGAQVVERRKQFKLTQQELADLAGVSVRLINRVEHGKPTAQLDRIVMLLDALGLDLVAVRRQR